MLSLILCSILGLPIAYLILWSIGWFAGGKCTSNKRLDGKIVVITGANTGIGYETALDLAKRGATIVTGCRDLQKAEKAAGKITSASGQKVHVIPLDLSSFASVRQFVSKVMELTKKIDLLINNAGVMIGENKATADGLELHMQVNHLGHFLLTLLLEPCLAAAAASNSDVRIINVSSDGHKFTMKSGLDIDNTANFASSDWGQKFKGYFAHHQLYGQSKLAQIYFTLELAQRYPNMKAYSLHPGAVNTEIVRYHQAGLGSIFTYMAENGLRWFGKTPLEGAQTTIFCCLDDTIAAESGSYFVDCKKVDIFPWLRDDRKQKLLWDVSRRLVGL